MQQYHQPLPFVCDEISSVAALLSGVMLTDQALKESFLIRFHDEMLHGVRVPNYRLQLINADKIELFALDGVAANNRNT